MKERITNEILLEMYQEIDQLTQKIIQNDLDLSQIKYLKGSSADLKEKLAQIVHASVLSPLFYLEL